MTPPAVAKRTAAAGVGQEASTKVTPGIFTCRSARVAAVSRGLGRRWPLVDAPQDRGLPVEILAARELPLVPPRCGGVGQARDRLFRLGGTGRAGSTEDEVE